MSEDRRRRTRQDALGRRLQEFFNDIVKEDVPPEFLDFLREIDAGEAPGLDFTKEPGDQPIPGAGPIPEPDEETTRRLAQHIGPALKRPPRTLH